MQISSPSQIVFPTGSSQQPCPITATGNVGTVTYTVTQVPSQVVSVRKTSTSAPLSTGATLTASEAANLVVTRSAGTGTATAVPLASITGVRSRAYQTGTSAPAFTVGDASSVRDGNFWVPDFPVGTGTNTVDLLFSTGTAVTLGAISDLLMQLGYASDDQTTSSWAGASATAIISTDGSTVITLGTLSGSADSGTPYAKEHFAGSVSGAVSALWFGVRLQNLAPSYPLIVNDVDAATAAAGSYTNLPTPVYFSVEGQDAGGLSAAIPNTSLTGVRTRVYQTGASAPAFAASDVSAVHDGNFWVPNFPVGTSTNTVDLLFTTGNAIALGAIPDLLMQLGYTYDGQSTSSWVGASATAIISADGNAVTTLNTLTGSADSTTPYAKEHFAGSVSGATSVLWFGVRLQNVVPSYPLILNNISVQSVGGGTSNASATVPIGDTTTVFGATPPASALTVYGDPGTRFPLDITVPDARANYALVVPGGLSLVQEVVTAGTQTQGTSFVLGNASGPFAPMQLQTGVTNDSLALNGTGASFDGTYLHLPQGAYLSTPSLGLAFTTTSDADTTQTPGSITLEYNGIIPSNTTVIAAVDTYSEGGIILYGNWQTGTVMCRLVRNGASEDYTSIAGLSNTAMEDIAVQYVDNAGGAGGTLIFLRNGAAFGPAQTTTIKPRIVPAADFECNAITGNSGAGGAIKVKKLGITLTVPVEIANYVPVTTGPVTGAVLANLFCDATAITASQPGVTVTYQASGGPVQATTVVIGPLAVPTGAAYRAVLEDWSSGAAMSHPDVLVMTKAARQNCLFEDSWLGSAQAPWTECIPQGAVPVIGGIAYRCEAIRMAGYVQFQFGYDWDASVMPANPFGDPSGLESYMVPHKWRIEAQDGTVLARIQRPDGGPLNGTDIPRIYDGPYDGRNCPMTDATNKWYPAGTVRAGVIWRSGTPAAYSQATITAQLPAYDLSVPYGGHTDYSNNGFDYRLYFGGAGADGQSNGFGNTRVMPYAPTNHATLVPTAGTTGDPYVASLYDANSLAAVASTWLQYTPFNQAGRTPLTGPGGVRDDRAAIAEPVACYMHDVTANRPYDGKPYAAIALDYCSSYVSDPYHCYENGRCVPLYKGANASRVITLRNHYYGPGEASTPANRAYYIQSGRASEICASLQPMRVYVPEKGSAADKPYFGTNCIDASHAHQYPHWGSMLWQTPEFAFLGHKLWDQDRLYDNSIVALDPVRWMVRDGAWQFLHAVLAWKTASANSDRLYSRAEVLAFVVTDFETFSDAYKTSSPGFDNPPTNVINPNGEIDDQLVAYAGCNLFGVMFNTSDVDGYGSHDFFCGYWVTALGIAEKLGFNAALRAASTKAGAVLDWIIAKHRQRIVGRINQAPLVNLTNAGAYELRIWRNADITAAAGAVSALPQNWAQVVTQNGNSATWDVYTDMWDTLQSRDGQATDQLLAGPSVLKYQLLLSGADIDSALSTAAGWRNQKKAAQLALGSQAGSSWFTYLNAVNNPAVS